MREREKAVFPFSRGKNRISQGVENRGSLIVPLALRVITRVSFTTVSIGGRCGLLADIGGRFCLYFPAGSLPSSSISGYVALVLLEVPQTPGDQFFTTTGADALGRSTSKTSTGKNFPRIYQRIPRNYDQYYSTSRKIQAPSGPRATQRGGRNFTLFLRFSGPFFRAAK